MEERRVSIPTRKGGGDASSFSILPVAGAVAVSLVAILIFVFWPRPAPPQEIAPTAISLQPTEAPTAVPTAVVPFIQPYVPLIDDAIDRGDYRTAQSIAQSALSTEGLSNADRRILHGYIVTAGLKEIESTTFDPLDHGQHQRLVDTYLSLREQARRNGVELPSPLSIAKDAHASSQSPLAKIAVEVAFEDGQFDPKIDLDVTKLYVSTLFGIGRWYTTASKDSPLYTEGVRALVASDLVADRYKTGQSEAEVLLEQLGYTDKSKWPKPLDTPLLP